MQALDVRPHGARVDQATVDPDLVICPNLHKNIGFFRLNGLRWRIGTIDIDTGLADE